MADMTDSAFCRLVREVQKSLSQEVVESLSRGIDKNLFFVTQQLNDLETQQLVVFREMVSAEAVVRGNEKTLDMTDIHPAERPLVQQIFGSDPAVMAAAAAKTAAEHQPEGFDINMGCPVYKIVHNFNGAALMQEPKLAAEIVKAVKAVIDVPLSIKIRLGWSNPTACIEFAKVLEAAGADMLTIHGRTKAQGYSGVADWEMIGRAKAGVKIPVLCNGDVHSFDLIPKALEISGCDGVLIARGALGNPWIFSQFNDFIAGHRVAEPSLAERLAVVNRHLDLHLEQYGEAAVPTFRKHLSWYFKGLPHFKRFKDPLMKAGTSADLRHVLSQMTETVTV